MFKLAIFLLFANLIHAQQNATIAPDASSTKPNQTVENKQILLNTDTKLLVNHTDNGQGVQRILNSHPVEAVIGESSSSAAVSNASSFTTLIILISLIVVACIAAAIISAIFIMKRRFSSWRINSSKTGEATAEDVETGDAKCTEVNEKCEAKVETANEQTEKVETSDEKGEIKQEVVVSTETPVEKTEVIVEQVANVEQSQASPSSESPLIEEQPQQTVAAEPVAIVAEAAEPTVEAVANPNSQSSTSLIANVLNELSESVACKLQTSKDETDPEKQPLNKEE